MKAGMLRVTNLTPPGSECAPAREVKAILAYPLKDNVGDDKMKKILDDDFGEIADAVVAGFESGELVEAVAKGEFKVGTVQADVS
jgi:hypothetical protein